ncbi:hypothetical protein B0I72DRAFT_137369 [Yarrowia lipolytica]|nr:hypothetical protein B0I72DRAFT_137369 [Yarrowia lipolytica]RDW37607.1 hypothetical protein B0I73DRAFT_135226 [Yarrowia lipolytica]RDW47889.1 hypothetical protein B0I74DRAFT_134642 [Yarrowia lipolytica]RDW55004.1 hypothetical protein B0I75DRAFT_133571 [Yarrowia lipolytica]
MTIAGLSQHLKPFYYKVKHGNTSLAKDKGKVFIDGDCFALRLTATGHYTLRSDWGGICQRVDEFMAYWKDWDIGAIIFDGQGPEIDRVASQQEVDDQMRFMCRFPFLGGRPNSVSAIVYDYIRDKYPHLNVIATASAQKHEILASTVYQYARYNRSEKVFLLGKDNRYAAYHWPENVHLCKIHTLKHDWEVSMLYPPRLLKKEPRLHCFELAFLCMERFTGNSSFKEVKKWLRTNDKYHKWREYQHNVLDTKHKLIKPYKHINLETDCFEVQRALNIIRNTSTVYKQMPLLNEPFWAESAFLAGRPWRSVAYELLMDRVQYMADARMHFVEGRREGSTIAMTKIPVCDRYREKEPDVYPPLASMMNRLQKITMKGLKRQIVTEIFKYTTSKNEDTRLDYEEEPYRKLVEVYMLQIWGTKKPATKEPDLTYRKLEWSDKSMYLNPTCLRIYNKLYACVYSLIILQSVVKLPYHFTMADLDSLLWIKLWKKHVGEPSMTREELARIADPPHLTDQFYSYSSDNSLRNKLHEARWKCLRLMNEGDDEGVVEAEKNVAEAEYNLVEAELDRQEKLQKAPVTALLLMTEYRKLLKDLEASNSDGLTPRFNVRLMKGRLERISDKMRYQYDDLFELVNSEYSWREGKEKEAIEQDRLRREEHREIEEERRQQEEQMAKDRSAEGCKPQIPEEAQNPEQDTHDSDSLFLSGSEVGDYDHTTEFGGYDIEEDNNEDF